VQLRWRGQRHKGRDVRLVVRTTRCSTGADIDRPALQVDGDDRLPTRRIPDSHGAREKPNARGPLTP